MDANFITNWDGPGLTSSTARTSNLASNFDLVGIGAIRNSDIDILTGLPGSSYTTFSGVAVTPDDILVKYTYIGDGNLDGLVSFDDYVGMDNAFFGLIPNLGWATGDINFDGVINFDDYSVVDQAFFFQGAPLSGEEAACPPFRSQVHGSWRRWRVWRACLPGSVARSSSGIDPQSELQSKPRDSIVDRAVFLRCESVRATTRCGNPPRLGASTD